MNIQQILAQIAAPRQAVITAETKPSPGLKKVIRNQRVLVSPYTGNSVYEQMVKEALERVGRNPDDFVLGQLGWGCRLEGSPLIFHRGAEYLQTITLDEGEAEYYFFGKMVDPKEFKLETRGNSQGLPEGQDIRVRAYKLDSITDFVFMD